MDMIAILTGVIIDLLGAQLPHNLDFSTSFRSDGVGDGAQAAEMRFPLLLGVSLAACRSMGKITHHDTIFLLLLK
jgi:hypothetical protein